MFVIDFHSHILPGIDDGSSSIKMSEAMLRMSSEQGVNVQVLTPHFYASRMQVGDFFMRRDEAIMRLKPVAERLGIRLRVGAEVTFFNNISSSDMLDRFAVNGTKVILIEMPFMQWTDKFIDEIEAIVERGFLPMIAHIERYFPLQHNKEPLRRLLVMKKVFFQVNCESLTHLLKRGTILRTLDDSVFVLGTDAHNVSNRRPNLIDGRNYISDKCGADQLNKMDMIGNILLGYAKLTQ
ncbi:MAG: capsular polysaccharide biosynthesis protein [Clostridia bacterium]|nr:capsular polysaccharide biosynthesis protein [Clostridia bacterium]